jgi:hypothetical protein
MTFPTHIATHSKLAGPTASSRAVSRLHSGATLEPCDSAQHWQARMTSDDGSPTTDGPQRSLRPVPASSSQLPTAGRSAAALARRTRLAASRRRPWWKWVLVGLLLAFSLTTTGLYAASLIRDLSQHHWGAAMDASRDAVPAAVGWAALILLFFPRSTTAAERLLSADDRALTERLQQAAGDQARLDKAQRKVQRLSAKLARLVAAREQADPAGRPAPEVAATPADAGVTYLDPGAVYLDSDSADLDREIAETTARLDQATQWLASARSAVSVSQRAVAAAEERLLSDFPDLARRPNRAAGKPA